MAGARQVSECSNASVCIALAMAAWIGNALYALGEPGGTLKYWSPALVASAMIAFLIIHGRASYTGRQLIGFAVTVFMIGWFFETLSILTGFPFGHYHYTDIMAPFVGHVPVFVMPAYLVMGYAAWSMARILLNRLDQQFDATFRFGVPVVAAFLMVIWDLSLDPLRATVEQRWIWRNGGPHLGVPLGNYFGWALVTWVMFQLFALQLTPQEKQRHIVRPGALKRYWLSVPLIYVAFAIEYLANPIVVTDSIAMISINGVPKPVVDIYAAVAKITATTMIPAALLAAWLVQRHFGKGIETMQAEKTLIFRREQ